MDSIICPLCGNTELLRKTKLLYEHTICKHCYYSFANRRQFAFFVDIIILRISGYVLGALCYAMAAMGLTEDIFIVAGIMLIGIFLCKDSFSGHSLGKLITGVKVIDKTSGIPIGFLASFQRNIPLFIPLMPLIVGFELCKGQRTGDGWANSKVIWGKYADNPIFRPESARNEIIS